MKRSVILLAFASSAAFGQQMETEARVVDVQPHYSQSTQYRQECSQGQGQQQSQYPNGTGAVIGGIAGALLGNTVGQGHGRTAAVAGGAIVGSMAGNNMQGSSGGQQCRNVPVQSSQQDGYDVTIDYNGQQQRVHLMNRPGRVVRIRISMSVLDSPSYDNDGYQQRQQYQQPVQQQYQNQNSNWR